MRCEYKGFWMRFKRKKKEWRSWQKESISSAKPRNVLGLIPQRLQMWNHPERYDDTIAYITLTASTVVDIIRTAKNQSEYYVRISEGCSEEIWIVE